MFLKRDLQKREKKIGILKREDVLPSRTNKIRTSNAVEGREFQGSTPRIPPSHHTEGVKEKVTHIRSRTA